MELDKKKKINMALFGIIAAILLFAYIGKKGKKADVISKWTELQKTYQQPDKKWRQVGLIEIVSSGKVFIASNNSLPTGWGDEKYTMSGERSISLSLEEVGGKDGISITLHKSLVSRPGTTKISRLMCAVPGARQFSSSAYINGKWYELSNLHDDCNDVDGEIITTDTDIKINIKITLNGERINASAKIVK